MPTREQKADFRFAMHYTDADGCPQVLYVRSSDLAFRDALMDPNRRQTVIDAYKTLGISVDAVTYSEMCQVEVLEVAPTPTLRLVHRRAA